MPLMNRTVREDNGAGVVVQRALDDFARVDAGLRQRATEQFLAAEKLSTRDVH